MRILGIDPGLATIGFAILDATPKEKRLIDVGVIRTPAGLAVPERLLEIHKDMQELIRTYKPEIASIEQIFFSKNVTTGIKVSEARGVILLAMQEAGLPIHEYSPSQMKSLLTGDGKADKLAIQKMVMLELGLPHPPKPDDAADALSMALCLSHALRFR